MYAYGNVVIRHPDVWALWNVDLDYSRGRTFYWTIENNRTVRMEVQTGVSDGEWTEATNHRPLSAENDPWQPIDGSQQVIAASDLSILVEGETVQIAEPAGEETEKPAIVTGPMAKPATAEIHETKYTQCGLEPLTFGSVDRCSIQLS